MGCVARSRIDERGRIGIPREMLGSLDLKPGDAVVLCLSKDHMLILPEDLAKRVLERSVTIGNDQ